MKPVLFPLDNWLPETVEIIHSVNPFTQKSAVAVGLPESLHLCARIHMDGFASLMLQVFTFKKLLPVCKASDRTRLAAELPKAIERSAALLRPDYYGSIRWPMLQAAFWPQMEDDNDWKDAEHMGLFFGTFCVHPKNSDSITTEQEDHICIIAGFGRGVHMALWQFQIWEPLIRNLSR